MTNLKVIIGLLSASMIFIAGCTEKGAVGRITTPERETVALKEVGNLGQITNKENGSYVHVNANDSVLHIMNNPAFEGFGQFILPTENGRFDGGMRLNNISALLPYHNHVDPDTTQ